MTNAEIDFIMNAIEQTMCHFQDWAKDYTYDPVSNEYFFKKIDAKEKSGVADWFNVSNWDKLPVID